jgi:hypothetical protein
MEMGLSGKRAHVLREAAGSARRLQARSLAAEDHLFRFAGEDVTAHRAAQFVDSSDPSGRNPSPSNKGIHLPKMTRGRIVSHLTNSADISSDIFVNGTE